jgi:hypothetical protein
VVSQWRTGGRRATPFFCGRFFYFLPPKNYKKCEPCEPAYFLFYKDNKINNLIKYVAGSQSGSQTLICEPVAF